jgi:hypothetical protein
MANYGFENSDDIVIGDFGYLLGKYRVKVIEEEDVPTGIKTRIEILSGKNKGIQRTVYYNATSENDTTARMARESLANIGFATKIPLLKTGGIPLMGRIFVVDVIPNKKNSKYNIVEYYHADAQVDESPVSESAPF